MFRVRRAGGPIRVFGVARSTLGRSRPSFRRASGPICVPGLAPPIRAFGVASNTISNVNVAFRSQEYYGNFQRFRWKRGSPCRLHSTARLPQTRFPQTVPIAFQPPSPAGNPTRRTISAFQHPRLMNTHSPPRLPIGASFPRRASRVKQVRQAKRPQSSRQAQEPSACSCSPPSSPSLSFTRQSRWPAPPGSRSEATPPSPCQPASARRTRWDSSCGALSPTISGDVERCSPG